MSNCSHQDSWKVFLERSGGLEGAGKAPSSQLPVKNGGEMAGLLNLGFPMFHRITYLGGVGQVVDSCILYPFLYIQPWKLGEFWSNFTSIFWVEAHQPAILTCTSWQYWNGVEKSSKSWGYPTPWEQHGDAVLLGCWKLLRHTRCRISMDVMESPDTWKAYRV